MVNKYWELKDVSYETLAVSAVCYGVIDDEYPIDK